MATFRILRRVGIAGCSIAGALLACCAAVEAGGFAVREQSTTFLGTAFAGSAAGGDISSLYWNSAAAAAAPGCNALSSYTLILGSSDETADSGLFVTGTAIAPGLAPRSADVGSDVVVPASYLTCQLSTSCSSDWRCSPFGLLTKPDNVGWAGSPIAVTSRCSRSTSTRRSPTS
jgi:long-chain fatty acid transport protein